MSIPEGYEVKYKRDLAGLIKNWAEFRKQRERGALAQFYHSCNDLSQEIASFGLDVLHQVVTNMSELAEAGLDDKKEYKALIKEIDWLMNQLIRASHESSDPLLNAAKTTTDEELLEQQSNAHPSHILRVAKPNIVIIDDQLSVAQSLAKTLEDFALNVRYFTSIDDF
ncbi:MAG: hypothetical protein ACJAVV_003848, partial [Alphaproteobacteria bacterium]